MAAGRPDVTTRRFGAARPPASGHPLEIIDSHTHATGFDLVNLGRRKIPTGQSALDLAFRCEQNEVDYAACYPIALPFHTDLNRLVHGRAEGIGPEAHPFELINRQHLFECGAQGSGRLLPFVAIDPTSEPVAQMNFVRTCSELIFGLKYHSTIAGQSVAVLEESGFTELASHLDLPFTLHSWLSPDHSRPEHVLAIAERRPQVRINVAHAAGLDASVVRRVASLPNVFIDCSPWQLNLQDYLGHSGTRSGLWSADARAALLMLYDLAPHSVLWGTDAPWTSRIDNSGSSAFTYESEVDLLRSLPSGTVAAIAWANPVRWLFGDVPYQKVITTIREKTSRLTATAQGGLDSTKIH